MRLSACFLLLASAMLLAACGGSETHTVTETETRTVTVTSTEADADDGDVDGGTQPATRMAAIYFVRGELLAPSYREVDGDSPASRAVELLVAGPDRTERSRGLDTTIPDGTSVLGVQIDDGTATVDLDRSFQSGGGSTSMQLRVAQVVYTLTQFESVDRVAFRLDGEPVDAIGGEGVVVSPPVDRSDFADQAPTIDLEQPIPGAAATSPIRIAGTANVFEGVLFVEVRDAGRVVVRQRIMASSGTGTRGTFSITLRFDDEGLADPQLVAYTRSPRDGSTDTILRLPLS